MQEFAPGPLKNVTFDALRGGLCKNDSVAETSIARRCTKYWILTLGKCALNRAETSIARRCTEYWILTLGKCALNRGNKGWPWGIAHMAEQKRTIVLINWL